MTDLAPSTIPAAPAAPSANPVAGRVPPLDLGTLEVLVCRPAVDERLVLDRGVLDPAVGLVGDSWAVRPSTRSADGRAHPDMQLNVMAVDVLEAITAGDRSRWPLAGDQLLVDLDLSTANLPVGSQLRIGADAVIEVTDQPHRGCAKFAARFGVEALRFVNTGEGPALRRRGLNARVVVGGVVRPGDAVVVFRR